MAQIQQSVICLGLAGGDKGYAGYALRPQRSKVAGDQGSIPHGTEGDSIDLKACQNRSYILCERIQ